LNSKSSSSDTKRLYGNTWTQQYHDFKEIFMHMHLVILSTLREPFFVILNANQWLDKLNDLCVSSKGQGR